MSNHNTGKRVESFSAKGIRNIAAPFQNKLDDLKSPSPTKLGAVGTEHHFEFTPLEPYSEVTYDKYCGPTPESNWVIPNVLLVGAYPASTDDGETFELLTSILRLGITKFVCLQQEYRTHGVTETMWRSGQALRPYFEDVKLIVRLKDSIPELQDCKIVDDANLSFVHFPIKDCGITDDGRVLELARNLVKAIAEKEIIYLHCWGGHGRTGTLVCIMLHLMYGLDAVECMARCQYVHDLRQCPVQVGSPQTQAQRDQVTRIINRLMTQNSFLRRTLSDVSISEQPSSPPLLRSPRSEVAMSPNIRRKSNASELSQTSHEGSAYILSANSPHKKPNGDHNKLILPPIQGISASIPSSPIGSPHHPASTPERNTPILGSPEKQRKVSSTTTPMSGGSGSGNQSNQSHPHHHHHTTLIHNISTSSLTTQMQQISTNDYPQTQIQTPSSSSSTSPRLVENKASPSISYFNPNTQPSYSTEIDSHNNNNMMMITSTTATAIANTSSLPQQQQQQGTTTTNNNASTPTPSSTTTATNSASGNKPAPLTQSTSSNSFMGTLRSFRLT